MPENDSTTSNCAHGYHPSDSTDYSPVQYSPIQYSPVQLQTLWQAAFESIRYGLKFTRRVPPPLKREQIPALLLKHRACFVTLKTNNRLRGCIGSLEAKEPLITNVINNAYNAAFRDPRFAPLSKRELSGLTIHLSILSPSEPLDVVDEQDLLKQLRPCVDGLILHDNNTGANATFLPSVWDELTEPQDFLQHLKIKAGLNANYWHSTLTFERYTVESFSQTVQPGDVT